MNLKIVDFLLNDRELWGAFGPPKGLLHRSRGKADTKPSAPERPSRRGRHWTIPSALTLCRSWAGPGKLHSLGEPPGGSQTEPPPTHGRRLLPALGVLGEGSQGPGGEEPLSGPAAQPTGCSPWPSLGQKAPWRRAVCWTDGPCPSDPVCSTAEITVGIVGRNVTLTCPTPNASWWKKKGNRPEAFNCPSPCTIADDQGTQLIGHYGCSPNTNIYLLVKGECSGSGAAAESAARSGRVGISPFMSNTGPPESPGEGWPGRGGPPRLLRGRGRLWRSCHYVPLP